MNVNEAMTTDLITLEDSSSVQEAAALMKKFNVGCILAMNKNKLVGLITDRDIIMRLVAENINPSDCKLKDYMSQSPVIVSPETDIHLAATIMAEHQIRRLPVVQNENLLGIVSLGDLAAESAPEADEVLQQVSKPIRREVA